MFLLRMVILSLFPLFPFVLATSQELSSDQSHAPRAQEGSGPTPGTLDKKRVLHRPSSLAVTSSASAQAAITKFVDWASASTVDETEDVRRAIAAARTNDYVAEALCEEAFRSVKIDHSRTIVALSLLGELRNPKGQDCLSKFIHLPFPETGTLVDGEVVEQTALGMLQGVAIDGLAYMRTSRADEEVFWAVDKHPSRIVRAEAINAYLWNHRDSKEARAALSKYVHRDELIFLDRIRREQGESAKAFNRKLTTLLKNHPELRPPAPEHSENKETKRSAEDEKGTYATKPPVR